jgi:hypothetical protein
MTGRRGTRRVQYYRQSDDRGALRDEFTRRAQSEQVKQTTAGGFIRGHAVDLGDMSGEVADPVEATFVWFGERFRVNPDLTETVVVDLFEKAQRVKVDDPEQFSAAKDYVREHIHPDDFDRFWQVTKQKRQNVTALMRLCWGILEGIAERPTPPPSDSSAGRPDTNRNSPRGASAPGGDAPTIAEHLAVQARQPDPERADWWPETVPFNPVAAKWVDRFEAEGRPDRANQLMLAQEARAGL